MANPTLVPLPTSGFLWNAEHQKIKKAIGRAPTGGSTVGGMRALVFDPPLDAAEEAAVQAIFADPATAAKVPTDYESFVIKDAFDSDFIDTLNAAVTAVHGNPIVFWIWFYRADTTVPEGRTNRIALMADRAMTVQEKKARDSAISSLLLGDMVVVEL